MAIDIGKFIKAPDYDITIVTYRDVFQAAICEEDRFGEACHEKSAAIILDPTEMKRMGIVQNSNVKITTRWGSVVVRAEASPRDEQKGIGFMVNSPWSNILVSGEAPDGIPEFKNIPATITATRENVTSLEELLNQLL